MAQRLQAKDVMQENIITVSPNMSLKEVAAVFAERQIGGAPVVSEDGELKGVISQTDIVREAMRDDFDEFIEHGYYLGLPSLPAGIIGGAEHLESVYVEEAMSPHVITVQPDDEISVLATTMRSHKFHRLIVVDNQKVIGVVTSLDLLQILEDH